MSSSSSSSSTSATEEVIDEDEVRIINVKRSAESLEVSPPPKRTRWSATADTNTKGLVAVVTWKSIFDIVSEWPRGVPNDYHSLAAMRIVLPNAVDVGLIHDLWKVVCDYAVDTRDISNCGMGSPCVPCHYNCDIRLTLQSVLNELASVSNSTGASSSVSIDGYSWGSWEFAEVIASYLRIECYNLFTRSGDSNEHSECSRNFSSAFHSASHGGYFKVNDFDGVRIGSYTMPSNKGFDPLEKLIYPYTDNDVDDTCSRNRQGDPMREISSCIGLWVTCKDEVRSGEQMYEQELLKYVVRRLDVHLTPFDDYIQSDTWVDLSRATCVVAPTSSERITGSHIFRYNSSAGYHRGFHFAEHFDLAHHSDSYLREVLSATKKVKRDVAEIDDGEMNYRVGRAISAIDRLKSRQRDWKIRNPMPHHHIIFEKPRMFLLMNGATFTLFRAQFVATTAAAPMVDD